jgi:hypothetical protein
MSKFPYAVYYTFSTEVDNDSIKKLQDEIFDYLETHYESDAGPTGYSHSLALGGAELAYCDGLTQDLEFARYADVIHFIEWLQDFSEICDITFHRWDENLEELEYRRVVKKESEAPQ